MNTRKLFLHNAFEARSFLEVWDEGTRTYVPFDGDATVCISETPGGSAINPALQKPMIETGVAGWHVASFSTADVDAYLTEYLGRPVYQIVRAGPANELQFVTSLLVTEPLHVP